MADQISTVDGKSVRHHNKRTYEALRKRFNVPDDFLAGFKFENLVASGGKGGDLLCFVGEDYVLKQVTGADQEILLATAGDLASHIESGNSLIARVYMHFYVASDGSEYGGFDYFVCNNWLPRRSGAKYHQVYDLKGSADDKTLIRNGLKIPEVHKRAWNVGMYSQCCWTPQRRDYYNGKKHAYHSHFHVMEAAKAEIMTQIRRDVKWFQDYNLMDYSLVVGVIEGKAGQSKEDFPAGSPGSGQPWLYHCGGVTIAYYMGIIDYLQEWNMGKKVAMCIKRPVAPQPQSTVPPAPYGDRYVHFFENKWVGESEDGSKYENGASSRP